MLLYNVKKEEMRIGKHKGKTMYYASPIAQDKITTKQLEDRIVNATALSRADVRSAITAFLAFEFLIFTVENLIFTEFTFQRTVE